MTSVAAQKVGNIENAEHYDVGNLGDLPVGSLGPWKIWVPSPTRIIGISGWVRWAGLEQMAQMLDGLRKEWAPYAIKAYSFWDNPSNLAIRWGEKFTSYIPALFNYWEFLSNLEDYPHCWKFSLRCLKNSHASMLLLHIKLLPYMALTMAR